MCTSLSPHCQYSELSLKQKVTILVTKLSLPAAVSKAAVAIGSRAGSSQQPSQLCSVCSRSRRRKIPHLSGVSPLLQTEKLNQRRLNTKYTPRPLVLSGPLLLFNAIFPPQPHICMLRVSNALLSHSCSLPPATPFVAFKIAQN
jgi:hypothetical protein